MPVTPRKPAAIDEPLELLTCLSPVPQRLADLAVRVGVTSGTQEVLRLIDVLHSRGFGVAVERDLTGAHKHDRVARIPRSAWSAASAAAERYALATD